MLVESLRVQQEIAGPGGPVVTGRLSAATPAPGTFVDLAVAVSGVGKAMAAMTTEFLVSRFSPRGIVMVGLAGALAKELNIGDLVLARDAIQYDLDASPLGFEPGEVPYSSHRFILSDSRLLEVARRFSPPEGRLHLGRILTGDRFIADPVDRSALATRFEGDAVEMEGAAAGLVARIHDIPFLLARTISDSADGAAPKSFNRFLSRASRQSEALIRFLLDNGVEAALGS